MKNNNRLLLTSLVVASSLGLASCDYLFTRNAYTDNLQVSNAAKGAATLAATGGAASLACGAAGIHSATTYGVAGGGAVVGAAGGYMMDRQEACLRTRLRGTGVRVLENVNDGCNDITLVMPCDVHFAPGSAAICPKYQCILDSVALVMKEFKYSVAEIPGTTDSEEGSRCGTMRLSLRRAQAVSDYLCSRGVPGDRLVPKGYGECAPIASNRTAEGRALNRRVYIILHQPPIVSNEPVLNPGELGECGGSTSNQ